jgi:hypothetical protein
MHPTAASASVWVDLLERKVPKHTAQPLWELALQLMHRVT